jgi:hypothetical protein
MRSIRTFSASVAIAVALLGAPAAQAAIVVLGFEGVNPTYPSASSAQILSFYSGGTSSAATSGTNFGISFASNAVAVCLNKLGGACSNASRGGASVTSARAALGIDSGTSTYLDFASAYTGAIAFSYQVAPGFSATIQAFSGLGGTGAALTGPLALFDTNPGGCPAYNAAMCTLGPGGLGSVVGAQSIVFTGVARRFVFDDLTFGAGNDPLPPPAFVRSGTPEPAAWALMILGFGGIGTAFRRGRAVQVS